MSRKIRVLSPESAMILRRFLDSPGDELHGFGIIRETGIRSSTLYPALRALAEERKLLTARCEQIDSASHGRPPRRLYRLDAAAAPAAREALAEHVEHERQRDQPSPRSLRPKANEA